ncbi:NADH-quinone oxidoreductase subunit L [Buchnera aphidicola (Tetraneura ulmi)]|uniref:NADH-quinone oxidoreductase subunit L n=1 Tax=Buchnera aphidicola TaxID=9 RepID=UPI0034649574
MNNISSIIFFPLLGFFILSIFQRKLSNFFSALIGIGSIFSSLTIIFYVVFYFFNSSTFCFFSQHIELWNNIQSLNLNFNLLMDKFSVFMLLMVGSIGFLIHVFSYWYMKSEEEFSTFFSYMNLFMASMFLLVLSDNLLLMYFAWELVGLCSYLLIGFYHKKKESYKSAMKAFIMTRIGDVFFCLSIFILYSRFETVNLNDLKNLINNGLLINDWKFHFSIFCLLIAAITKSAQIPLQTWLPDAMVGPTPVSALIHASTMITAGVYLIVRTNFLFSTSPIVLCFTGVIGTLTVLFSCFSALFENNIKKILAYSTMSQIGYMFIAISVKCWNAAIMHLVTHSFFKSLLFLSSASIISFFNGEENIFKMGGLIKKQPFLYFCFLVGGSSLSSLPLITSGFYTKGEILYLLLENKKWFFLFSSLLGVLLTSIYTFRMIFLIFYVKNEKQKFFYLNKGFFHTFPLFILLVFSTFFIMLFPPFSSLFFDFYNKNNIFTRRSFLEFVSSLLSIIGLLISYDLYVNKKNFFYKFLKNKNFINNFCYLNQNFGFDFFYDFVFVKSYFFIVKKVSFDPFRYLFSFFYFFVVFFYKIFLCLVKNTLSWHILFFIFGVSFFCLFFSFLFFLFH